MQKATDHSTRSGLQVGRRRAGSCSARSSRRRSSASAAVLGGAGAAVGKVRELRNKNELAKELEDAILPGHSGLLALVSDPGEVKIRKALEKADRIVEGAIEDVVADDIKAAAKEADAEVAPDATGAAPRRRGARVLSQGVMVSGVPPDVSCQSGLVAENVAGSTTWLRGHPVDEQLPDLDLPVVDDRGADDAREVAAAGLPVVVDRDDELLGRR